MALQITTPPAKGGATGSTFTGTYVHASPYGGGAHFYSGGGGGGPASSTGAPSHQQQQQRLHQPHHHQQQLAARGKTVLGSSSFAFGLGEAQGAGQQVPVLSFERRPPFVDLASTLLGAVTITKLPP